MPTRADSTSIALNGATKEKLLSLLEGRTPDVFISEILALSDRLIKRRHPGQSLGGVIQELLDLADKVEGRPVKTLVDLIEDRDNTIRANQTRNIRADISTLIDASKSDGDVSSGRVEHPEQKLPDITTKEER